MRTFLAIATMALCGGCETVQKVTNADDPIEAATDLATIGELNLDALLNGKPPATSLDAAHLQKRLRRRKRGDGTTAVVWPITPLLIERQTYDRGLSGEIAKQEVVRLTKNLAVDHTCFGVDLDVDTYRGEDAQTKSWVAKLDVADQVFDLAFQNPIGEAEPTNKKHKEWTNHDIACTASHLALPLGFDVVLIPQQRLSAQSLVLKWKADD